MKAKQGISLFFAFCILLLGAWAGYDYYQSKNKKEREEKQSLLLPDWELKSLKSFKIITPDKKIVLQKKNKDWFVVQPVEDLASFSEISRWLGVVSQHKLQKIEGESINWEDYGLGALSAKVELEKSSGEKLSFFVSNKDSFDGNRFIKKAGQLFITGPSIYSEVNNKDFEGFRSKKILPSLQHATQIEIKEGKSPWTLNWKDYQWSLENKDKDSLPLDQELLDEFWTGLTSLKASAILGPKAESKKYKLHKPVRIFNILYGDKKYQLKISPFKSQKAFAVVTGRNFIFEIPQSEVEKILLNKKDIYDHQFPFNYNKEQAQKIEIQSPVQALKLTKEDGKWWEQVQPLAKAVDSKTNTASNKLVKKELDFDKVEEFLDQITQLKAVGYKPAQKFSAPLKSLYIKDSKDEVIFSLSLFKQTSAQSWFKTSVWKDWIALPTTDIKALFQTDFTPDKAESKAK